MRFFRYCLYALIFFCCLAVTSQSEEPEKVSVCQLKGDPSRYNHALVEVVGFVSQGFEDFTLFDPTCPPWPEVWLEYGGKSKSGTMYCCGVSADRQRPNQLTVEDIPIPLVENDNFTEFDKQIHRQVRQSALMHGTLIGRFFAGRQQKYGNGPALYGGYGHEGCCSLLAIEEIKAVDSQNNNDLDYDRYADQPDIDKKGCGYQGLVSIDPFQETLQAQHQADLEQHSWTFDDPRRVASDALIRLANLGAPGALNLKETRKEPGRITYQWRGKAKSDIYMLVVSRPYWLSFYSRDPNRVAWVVLGAYLSSCGEHNDVIRIK